MKLGFSASRFGMSPAQREAFISTVRSLTEAPHEFHHGDCVGGDKEAHDLIRSICPYCRIVVHPGRMIQFRAYCKGDLILDPDDELERNRHIVDGVAFMVTAPKTDVQQWAGSGTWATIRYTKRVNKPIVILKR